MLDDKEYLTFASDSKLWISWVICEHKCVCKWIESFLNLQNSLAVPDSSAWFLVLHGGKEAWHSMIPEELKMTDAW